MNDKTPRHDETAADTTVGSSARLAGTALDQLMNGAARGLLFLENWLVSSKKATYGLAVTRILLGIMIVTFVLANLQTMRYTFGPGAAWSGQLLYPTSDFANIFPFSLVNEAAHTGPGILFVAFALILCAILFTIGYRTRLVMVPLFVLWVGFLSINTYVQDQSDNLTRISLMYMLFAALSDRWSVDALRRKKYEGVSGTALVRGWRFQQGLPAQVTNAVHNLAVVLIICQLCFVYASGGLFKAAGLPWQDGTAVYAPLMTQRFGTWPILSEIATAWGPGVAIATLGTVLVQVSFPFLMLNRFTRFCGIIVILGFHAGIGLLMGLPWFSLSMVALDAVFIRDRTWKKLGMTASTVFGKRPRPRGARATDEPVPSVRHVAIETPVSAARIDDSRATTETERADAPA